MRGLAHLTGKSPSTITRLEEESRGSTADTLGRIAAALDIPVEAITRESL